MLLHVPILGKFEFGRPQLYAALLLVLLAGQALYFAATQPLSSQELAGPVATAYALRFGTQPSDANSGLPPLNLAGIHDSILEVRAEQAVLLNSRFSQWLISRPHAARLWLRFPFIVFALWLGGALWWVARRLFSNPGGYLALALYCTSPWVLAAGAHVNAEILAAWGLFGLVFTAIGVAHTLYAPPHKWRVRIVLLGLALGLTAAAHLSAALLGVVLAAGFMLYLAPGRRMASLGILLASVVIAAGLLWALYGFGDHLAALDLSSAWRLHLTPENLHQLGLRVNAPLLALLAAALITLALWRRPRYFGNLSPLFVVVVLLAFAPLAGRPLLWALPFIFVLVGGVFSDLFETRHRQIAITAAAAMVLAQLVFCLAMLAGIQNFT